MKIAAPLFLAEDTLVHLDWIAQQLSGQRNASTSRSEAVEWLVKRHWMKMQKQQAKASQGPARLAAL